ncbi:NAD(P)-binding protein [Corynespora cassiicola Philippines]|uniref:NAD(P)-binding protein n=1 Tax=Corynespora cassiicola Philippines TaxID=1448308 RepID=A0A2T2N2F1_CORCC|nr:NAD(P)-binding protein [Corynespora cassiicola Philippines]
MPFTEKQHLEIYPALSLSRADLWLSGKSVLITGGGYGIGAGLAHSFAQAKASRIAICGRTESRVKETASELQSAYPETKIEYYIASITDEKAVQSMFDSFGCPDILVNNAGAFFRGVNLKDIDLKDWWATIETNLLGTAIVTQTFLRAKSEGQPGTVIMMNSSGAHWGKLPGMTHYVAGKAGVFRFSELLQSENPEVRVFNVSPGFVETDMMKLAEEAGLKGFPMTSKDLVGNFAVWLCSSEADFLKGRFVRVGWDIEELKEKKEEIVEKDFLTCSLSGMDGQAMRL